MKIQLTTEGDGNIVKLFNASKVGCQQGIIQTRYVQTIHMVNGLDVSHHTIAERDLANSQRSQGDF